MNSISTMISLALEGTEFKRLGKSQVWKREADETVDFMDLQCSTRGRYYYVNLGIVLKVAPHKDRIRRVSDCHLTMRLDELLPFRSRKELVDALDLEVRMEDAVRADLITFCFRNYALPLFARYSSGRQILALARTPRSKRFGEPQVWWHLLDYAGIPKRELGDPDYTEWGP